MTKKEPLRIEGTTALVTGANRGFGRTLVEELLERGAKRVYATSRSLVDQTDPRVQPLILDITDTHSVRTAAAAAHDVSIVINNAGVALGTPVLTAPLAQMQDELDANLFGVIRVARAFAPALAANQPSCLMNVLSVMSWLSAGRGYEISKAAAWSATNALRLALHRQGVTVTALHVSYMDTDMTRSLTVPKSDPREIAKQAIQAIADGRSEVIADDHSRLVKERLSQPIESLYPSA